MSRPERECRLDRILGREVHAPDGRRVGRIEEFHAQRRGAGCVISGYVIGAAGLLQRLDVGARRLIGGRVRGYLARIDQIDLTDPDRPRLTCGVDALERI